MKHTRPILLGLLAGVAVAGCLLFPSLDELVGADAGGDASDDAVVDASEASDANASDASDAGCSNGDPSLVLYFPFDEGSGLTAHDCSGNDRTGTVYTTADAGTIWTQGHTNGALQFTSSTSTCVVLNDTLNQTGAFTVALWVNAPAVKPYPPYYLIGRRAMGVLGWRLAEDANQTFSFQIGEPNDGSTGPQATAITPPISAGVWHHLAGVFSPGQSQTVYVDGAPIGTAVPAPSVSTDVSTVMRIGCKGDSSSYVDAVIDEVRVYSRALSNAEIMTLAGN